MSGLVARVVVRFESFVVDVGLEVGDGRTVALLGPNGAGKSTVVSAIAGLRPLDAGSITLHGSVLDDPAEEVFVAPERRGVGVVFQDYRLFPRLTVKQNIAFGLRNKDLRRSEIRALVAKWLDDLDLLDLSDMRPEALSGGQAQRVALARTLITGPSLLLLDEPLSAMDVSTRTTTRRYLEEHLQRLQAPRVLVTHDAAEAFMLADEVIIVEDGGITHRGTPDEIRLRPRSRYAADLAGVNLLRGDAFYGTVDVNGHPVHVADHHTSGPVLATVEPRAIALYRERPEGSPRNTWQTRIDLVERLGERVRVRLGDPLALTAEVTPGSLDELGLVPGSVVWVSIKATEVDLVEQ